MKLFTEIALKDELFYENEQILSRVYADLFSNLSKTTRST